MVAPASISLARSSMTTAAGKRLATVLSSALVCGLLQAVLQVLEEAARRRPGHRSSKRQAQVLGEGALARAVEPGDPDADFVLAARFHRQLHLGQQLLELLLDALGDDVLGDLGLQARLLRRAVGDDLLDGAVDVLGWGRTGS